jgi:hypothetical protein
VHLVDGDLLRAMLKLPDHLDTAPPGSRPAEKVARTAAAARRRSGSERSFVLPVIIGVVILTLMGLFVWRAMGRRDDTPPPLAAAPAAAAPAQPSAPAPAALPPTQVATVPVTATPTASRQPEVSDGLAHELAERERARREEDAAANRKKQEDALKVMERNTREVGSY